jgi:hypothetical protein
VLGVRLGTGTRGRRHQRPGTRRRRRARGRGRTRRRRLGAARRAGPWRCHRVGGDCDVCRKGDGRRHVPRLVRDCPDPVRHGASVDMREHRELGSGLRAQSPGMLDRGRWSRCRSPDHGQRGVGGRLCGVRGCRWRLNPEEPQRGGDRARGCD